MSTLVTKKNSLLHLNGKDDVYEREMGMTDLIEGVDLSPHFKFGFLRPFEY